ncbi:major capsid protein [Deinococcus ficus]|uniref:major capsid protein n=1 Tax=Deinococcus ficus TaxID=317577 RepID=UPI00131D67FF|nr:hypothetical protein [Deinococcus ficus]
MLTLVEAQKLIQDEVQAGVVFSTYIRNPIMNLIPFETVTGTAVAYNRAVGLGSGSNTRAINADYVEGTVGFTRHTAALGRLGGKAQVDNFLQVTGSNVNDQLAVQIEAKARQTAMTFQNYFFNGDVAVDPNGFDGLKKLLAGTEQVLDDGTPDVLSLGALDAALMGVEGDASAIFVNDKTLMKINSLAKGSGLVQFNSLEMVGSRVSSYAGVPLVRVGKTTSGNILEDGEIYVVRFGADGVHGLQANTPTVKVISPDDNANAPVWTARLDWYTGIAQKDLTSAYRLVSSLT